MIIAVTKQKGGVGKTTTSINVSAALALFGKKVLLIDMDPQAHSTISTVANPAKYEKSLYDVLMNKKEKIENIIVSSTIPGLDMAIAKISMAKLEPSLLGEFDGHFRLKDALESIRHKYNFILIDTPPTLGLITLYDKRTNLARDVVERIKRVFGNKLLKTFISKSVKLEESPAYKESIFTYAPDSIGADQYRKVAEEILDRAKN